MTSVSTPHRPLHLVMGGGGEGGREEEGGEMGVIRGRGTGGGARGDQIL